MQNKLKNWLSLRAPYIRTLLYVFFFLGALSSLFVIVYDALIIGWFFENDFDYRAFLSAFLSLGISSYFIYLLVKSRK